MFGFEFQDLMIMYALGLFLGVMYFILWVQSDGRASFIGILLLGFFTSYFGRTITPEFWNGDRPRMLIVASICFLGQFTAWWVLQKSILNSTRSYDSDKATPR